VAFTWRKDDGERRGGGKGTQTSRNSHPPVRLSGVKRNPSYAELSYRGPVGLLRAPFPFLSGGFSTSIRILLLSSRDGAVQNPVGPS